MKVFSSLLLTLVIVSSTVLCTESNPFNKKVPTTQEALKSSFQEKIQQDASKENKQIKKPAENILKYLNIGAAGLAIVGTAVLHENNSVAKLKPYILVLGSAQLLLNGASAAHSPESGFKRNIGLVLAHGLSSIVYGSCTVLIASFAPYIALYSGVNAGVSIANIAYRLYAMRKHSS